MSKEDDITPFTAAGGLFPSRCRKQAEYPRTMGSAQQDRAAVRIRRDVFSSSTWSTPIRLTLAPVLLGDGLRLFGNLPAEQRWELSDVVPTATASSTWATSPLPGEPHPAAILNCYPALVMTPTVQQHILDQQRQTGDASGTFSWMLSGITLATKMISARIRSAGLSDVLGAAGSENVQGEAQQKLDVFANDAMLSCLGSRGSVAALISEENDEPVIYDHNPETGKYIIVFDPLDGSSNIDVNVNTGTIFSIFRRPRGLSLESALLQSGLEQVAAGYVVYGPSTIFVYTAGRGVFGFTLDPSIGAYVLSFENMMMPEQGSYYSVNEANFDTFPAVYRQYLGELRTGKLGRAYSSRYIGSLVADFHRTLLKGGVFLYPPTAKQTGGKLRLLYEANPLAFIAEQAGGRATTGAERVLSVQPEGIHQRTPLIVGSRVEVERLEQMLAI